MWGWTFLLLFGVFAWQARREGSRRALGVVVILSLLVPAWSFFGANLRHSGLQFVGQPIDMRIATSFVGIAVCCLRPRNLLLTRWVATDAAIVGLVIVHVLSDWKNEGLSATVVVRPMGEWVLPYLAGRLTLTSVEDVRKLLPFAVTVCVAFAGFAAIESLSRVNLYEMAYGACPVYGEGKDLIRLGLKRAYGPVLHPICFGVLQLLLFPWTCYAFQRGWRGVASGWWQVTPAISAAGICFSVSRAPILGIPILLYTATLILQPRWRPALLATGLIAALVALTQWQMVIGAIHAWTGDQPRKQGATVTVGNEKVRVKKDAKMRIGGDDVVVTSALHRVYVFEVYGLAMREAGLLGYGTERVTGKPMRVPVSPEHLSALRRIWVENGYVMFVLRFGYLGVCCFFLLCLSAVINFARLGWQAQRPGVAFYAAMTGAIVATMCVLMTVWMPYDFGFVLLWTAGAGAGLWANARFERRCPGMVTS